MSRNWTLREVEGVPVLGQYIRQVREARGMRQEDLGLAIGKDGNYITRLETGRLQKFPEPEIIHALARELGVTVVDILTECGYLSGTPHDADDARDDPAVARATISTNLRRIFPEPEASNFDALVGSLYARIYQSDADIEASIERDQPRSDGTHGARRAVS